MTETFVGLHERATDFLEENAVKQKVEIAVDGIVEHTYYRWKTFPGKFSYFDPFNDYVALLAYELKDGTIVYEKECADIWDSGPYIFTNLVREDGSPVDPALDWTEKEMYAYVYGQEGGDRQTARADEINDKVADMSLKDAAELLGYDDDDMDDARCPETGMVDWILARRLRNRRMKMEKKDAR